MYNRLGLVATTALVNNKQKRVYHICMHSMNKTQTGNTFPLVSVLVW